MQLHIVDLDQCHTSTTPSTTFTAKAGTQFTDPDGIEGWVIFIGILQRVATHFGFPGMSQNQELSARVRKSMFCNANCPDKMPSGHKKLNALNS